MPILQFKGAQYPDVDLLPLYSCLSISLRFSLSQILIYVTLGGRLQSTEGIVLSASLSQGASDCPDFSPDGIQPWQAVCLISIDFYRFFVPKYIQFGSVK
ncbi:hypothetical protein AVEN_101367-1 [Araneus ventricosus]|uniref:Uncharacterized protein n=1 Tax=Araneus ventricosus TaxID=182803 RepID=A0A4Y2ML60_ARAVE|nr:hypothetical protein AVEN_101367-1 [Araneus ventricosus]